MKTGNILEWEQKTLSAQPNLTWYATCTLTTTNIRFTNPAPATLKSLIDG